MKQVPYFLYFAGTVFLSYLAIGPRTLAQIVPDASLPVNSSITTSGNNSIINGGTINGGNLFHSFQEFSIPTGFEAFFNNGIDIQNILTRVTAGKISNIDGLIRANGTANLFFINPAGIIFGPNAALNIGGAFIGSTAESIKLSDGSFFSATNPFSPPVLTVNIPIGLQMGTNPGSIAVQGSGHNLSFDPVTGGTIRDNRPVGLQVSPGQTLALVGGDIKLEGGNLTAVGGRIELGSVAAGSLVNLVSALPPADGEVRGGSIALDYSGVQNFQDINLSKVASADASGAGAGNVQVVSRRLLLSDGSMILAETLGALPGGEVTIRASELVEATGGVPESFFPTAVYASVQIGASGDGGNLTVETLRLRVADGAVVATDTYGSGKSGNLTVRATEAVEVIGVSANGRYSSGLLSTVAPTASGDAGDITVETARFRIADGAFVSTFTVGSGKAGNLTVRATEKVEVIGSYTNSEFGYVSGLRSDVIGGATGEAGNLTIETARLRVADGAQIGSGTFGTGKGANLTVRATDAVEAVGTTPDGQVASGLFTVVVPGAIGDGGNLTIETDRLRVADGAVVSSATFGTGKAGNLTVRANKEVELIGTTPITAPTPASSGLFASVRPGAIGDGGNLTVETAHLRLVDGGVISAQTAGSGKSGNVTVRATDAVEVIGISANSQLRSELLASSKSDFPAGNLTIETGSLLVQDGASINVSGSAGGAAGNLIVNADNILLANKASLTAATKAGQGNINLFAPAIILRGNSNITTDATGSEIIGGNIVIDSDVLAALENSDISANSAEFRGGTVRIDADGIFGTQFRFQQTDSSDITATGADSSLNGTVTINTPDVDPSSGLVELASGFSDPTNQIAAACPASGGNSFVVTGNGGLPADPSQTLRGRALWRDVRLVESRGAQEQRGRGELSVSSERSPIVEATGWIMNPKGQVELVTNVPHLTGQSAWYKQAECGDR